MGRADALDSKLSLPGQSARPAKSNRGSVSKRLTMVEKQVPLSPHPRTPQAWNGGSAEGSSGFADSASHKRDSQVEDAANVSQRTVNETSGDSFTTTRPMR